ncbi:MAG: transposase, partial [Planctomycetota bacterium]
MAESKGLRRKVKKHEQKAQVLEGNPMVVAMDLAKKRHAVWVTDRSRRPLGRFIVDHSADGMNELDRRVKALCAEKGYDRPVFFMEPTANFWKNVTQALGRQGHTYRLIPGLATARQREIDSASFAKSDYKDAEMISNLGLNLNFCARQLETGDVWTEMSYLAAEYQDATELAIREKVRIRSFLDLICPEYLGIVGERYYTTKNSLALLMALPDAPPGQIPPADAWIQKVRPHFRGKHLRLKLARAVHAALVKGSAYGVAHLWKSVSWRIKQAAERHLLLQAQLETTQAELLQRYRALPYAKDLDTIRGVSETQNALVLAFTGDPAQYDDSSCLVKLAGTEQTYFRGPARVFDAEEDALRAVLDRQIKPGDVVVI